MVWQKKDAHNFGRWKQPVLSMVFWNRWGATEAYRKTGLRATDGEMALLDGHTIGKASDIRMLNTLCQKAMDSGDFSAFERVYAVSDQVLERHLALGQAARMGQWPDERLLKELFASWHELCTTWFLVIPMAVPLERALFELADANRISKTKLSVAMAPEKRTPLIAQGIDARRLAGKIREKKVDLERPDWLDALEKKDATLASEIRRHLEAYAWVGTHHLWGNGLDAKTFAEQMQTPGSDFKAEAPALPAPMAILAEHASRMAYYRQYSAEVSDMTAFYARPCMRRVAARFGLSYGQLLGMLDTEILESLAGKDEPNVTEINRRGTTFGIVIQKGEQKVIHGQTLKEWTDVLLERPDPFVQELTGVAAHIGTATANAFVAFTPYEAECMTAGSILVVPQTTPDFVPFMRRAAAIVTDEGGLTCHAAIMSREMGKPCVTGTRHATTVLKTGEKIRVDGTRGIVNRLQANEKRG